MRPPIPVPVRLFAAFICLFSSSAFAQEGTTCAPAPGYREVALLGEQRDALAGETVIALGDINGDGMEDYAVAAPQFSRPGLIFSGALYVVYGTPHQPPFSLGLLGPDPQQASERGFVILGDQENAGGGSWRAGGTVQAMGDLDGDGVDDFAVGQRITLSADGEFEGAVYFFYGKRATAESPAFPAQIMLADVVEDTYGDQVRVHYPQDATKLDVFGTTVTPLGDFDDDGHRDFAISAPGDDQTLFGGGKILVYRGQPGRPRSITPFLTLRGSQVVSGLGSGLIGDFDFDGDGSHDLMVCASFEDTEAFSGSGSCYLLWGEQLASLGTDFSVGELLPKNGGDGSKGIVFRGGENKALIGLQNRVVTTVDINGDGKRDLIFGGVGTQPADATRPDMQVGRVYAVFGGTPDFVELSLASLASSPTAGTAPRGFVLEGVLQDSYNFGHRLAAAGDVNGDGIGDLLASSPRDSRCGGIGGCGAVWVIMGRRGEGAFPPLTRVGESTLAGGLGYRFGPTEFEAFEGFGSGLASLRDFTGDGKPEWLVGAFTSRFGDGIRGKACLYLSSNGQIITPPPPLAIPTASWPMLAAMASMLLMLSRWSVGRRN